MLVSILIPCFNAERWVAQAIESALAQTWKEKEIIVVDDGSSDQSLSVIKRFGDQIQWRTGPNRGGNSARNRLLELAQGEWLQYLDADDYLLPDKIERQVVFLDKHRQTDIVFSRVVQETQLGAVIEQGVSLMPEPHDPWVLLVRWDLPQTGASLWRAQAVRRVGGWKVDQPCCQEHELYLRLLMNGCQFEYCPDIGAVYRQWAGGSVCTRDPMQVHRQRIDIIRRAEVYLEGRRMLSPERLWAINQGRFEVARKAWCMDPRFGLEIDAEIKRSHPTFLPGGKVAPRQYRLIYRLFGFQAAERVAKVKRMCFGSEFVNSVTANPCKPFRYPRT